MKRNAMITLLATLIFSVTALAAGMDDVNRAVDGAVKSASSDTRTSADVARDLGLASPDGLDKSLERADKTQVKILDVLKVVSAANAELESSLRNNLDAKTKDLVNAKLNTLKKMSNVLGLIGKNMAPELTPSQGTYALAKFTSMAQKIAVSRDMTAEQINSYGTAADALLAKLNTGISSQEAVKAVLGDKVVAMADCIEG